MKHLSLIVAAGLMLSGCSHFQSEKISHTEGSETAAPAPAPKAVKHTICFEKGSAALPSDLADSVVPHSKHLIINPYTKVLVEGMANDSKGFEENMALGLRRAQAVKNALIALGVDPDQIIVRSSGNTRPQSLQKAERTRCVVLSY